MKNIVILILIVTTGAFGTLYFIEHGRATKASTQLSEAGGKLNEVEQQLRAQQESVEQAKFAEKKAEVLQSTLKDASSAVNKSTEHVKELEASLAAAKTNKSANPLAGMFNDPKSKEMIKSMQEKMIGPMVDKTYGGFLKEQKLSTEQSDALKDLLKKKMLIGSEMGMSMLSGDLDETKRKEMMDKMTHDTETMDAQIKELLGDENYTAFQKYEKSSGERMAVGQFRDQMTDSATPMSGDQEKQLIDLLSTEHSNFKWTTDYQNKKPGSPGYADMFSEDRINTYESERAEYDRQVLAKIGTVLNAEQLTAFEKFQESQRQMQMFGMKMASKMLAPKK